MSTKRKPAPPPSLPGFDFIEVLGSGGFADVYLYQQLMPRRRVAVKVLLPSRLEGGSVEQFAAEANVMAMLSTHPAIVTIYQAGVAHDDRPYLVMEYCPRPNLQVRSRATPFSVAEALRVGIQVASAAETAHRAGILHRDIKPANILVTEYNRPALTDFGIAARADADADSSGMSIPWSPPEAFADTPESGVRSDVWALGATVYTLLAGRSPFEIPGGRNGGAELIRRIETQPLPPLQRPDIPASLHAALSRALAKNPVDRFDSAIAFARALQRVQIELAHSVTPVDILDDAPLDPDSDDADDELTRVRGIVSIDPQTAPAAGSTRQRTLFPASGDPDPAGVGESFDDATVARAPVTVSPDPTVTAPPTPQRAAIEPDAPEPASVAGSRPTWRIWAVAGIGAVALVGILTAATVISGAVAPAPSPSVPATPQDPLAGVILAPTDLTGTIDGDRVTFQWTNPDPQEGDAYLWFLYTLEGDGVPESTTKTSVTVPADPSGDTCIDVRIVRANGTAGNSERGCVP
ncbi:protein kinase domain-containing protein [Microbacterium sp.]|uniref:serine/threonine-protein kinase n=1 Tax=Microbacterium sp. TaxID=51671 RepID=UPI003A89767C